METKTLCLPEYKPPTAFADRVVETAMDAARIAGHIQMHAFRHGKVKCSRLLHDVKLETDRSCEAAIVRVLRKSFPDHAILTEERGWLPGEGEYTWIVDPLDGTVNFWQGIPFFGVSIACYRNSDSNPETGQFHTNSLGEPIAGLVFLPVCREMFVGIAGRGAFLNDRQIHACQVEHTRDLVVSLSFGKTPEVMQLMTRRLDKLLPQVRKARCLGAAAVELAYASAGFVGAVVYEGIKAWDFAAAKILVQEAGGFLEAVETQPGQWRVLAGSRTVEQSLTQLLSL